MINDRQKAFLHIYKAAADLTDSAYRNILARSAGVSSSADRRFGQDGFDRAMAAIETILFDRVAEGLVETPLGKNRWISDQFYWRNRLPSDGYLNTRQAHAIRAAWQGLCAFLPADKQTSEYLAGIIRHATGRPHSGYLDLTHADANIVIDALKDRLSHAIRSPEPALQEVPF